MTMVLPLFGILSCTLVALLPNLFLCCRFQIRFGHLELVFRVAPFCQEKSWNCSDCGVLTCRELAAFDLCLKRALHGAFLQMVVMCPSAHERHSAREAKTAETCCSSYDACPYAMVDREVDTSPSEKEYSKSWN